MNLSKIDGKKYVEESNGLPAPAGVSQSKNNSLRIGNLTNDEGTPSRKKSSQNTGGTILNINNNYNINKLYFN